MKSYKAAGIDDICTEQLRHLGPGGRKWIIGLFNYINIVQNIPKIWRKSKITAQLKPVKWKRTQITISIQYHTYKIYERMLLNRLMLVIDKELIKEQSCFRPRKSCSNQILNLTQNIENGSENKQSIGLAFVELSTAYDPVNHKIMLTKLCEMTYYDYNFVKIIEALLSNRRFFFL